MKTTKIIYWILLGLFALMNLGDGIGGFMHQKDGVEAFKTLGYPLYVLGIVGLAKILGVIALLQPRFKILKEWAFAGFTINFIGASASWAFTGGHQMFIFLPLIMLAVLMIIYWLGKKCFYL